MNHSPTPKFDPSPNSVCGLLSTSNRAGRGYLSNSLRKWVRALHDFHKVEKADVWTRAADTALWGPVFEEAAAHDIALGLCVDATEPESLLTAAPAPGWTGVLVRAAASGAEADLKRWLAAAQAAGKPMRVLLAPPYDPAAAENGLADILAGAAVVYVTLGSALHPGKPSRNGKKSGQTATAMNQLARVLARRGVEVNLHGLPFCQCENVNWAAVMQSQQQARDFQHYRPVSWVLAKQLAGVTPARADKLLEIVLGANASFHTAIDRWVFPWILESPARYFRVWALHKLTRHLPWRRKSPPDLPEGTTTDEQAAERLREEQQRTLGPVCSKCRFARVCDHASEQFRWMLPGLAVNQITGEALADPLALSRERTRYCDAIDAARREFPGKQVALAEWVKQATNDVPPTREINCDSFDIEGRYTHHMPGAVRWCAYSTEEMVSTPLGTFTAPFTVGLTFGGGIAAQIGFAIGRNARAVCPMISFTHKLQLHVAANGDFVLLRDGELVRPTEFEDWHAVPRRLPTEMELRLSIWNIDGQVSTQNIQLWEHAEQQAHEEAAPPDYSAIIVSSLYSRRLQATLMGLLHQRDFDLKRLEIIVAYVPGIDATDDILDGIKLTYPEVRIVRSPFHAHHRKAKGMMINESRKLARGKWLLLLDSDIVLPPDFLSRAEVLAMGAHYIAPEGRKMLPPDVTAKILLGEIRPWEQVEALLAGPGDERMFECDGIPPGFCQLVRGDIFDQIRYTELDHFEGSDWWFSKYIVDRFGKEARLPGRVLHLDHGGSQWYGVSKQM